METKYELINSINAAFYKARKAELLYKDMRHLFNILSSSNRHDVANELLQTWNTGISKFGPLEISRKRIKTWGNKFKNKKAVILCNGPSLNKVNFNMLKNSGVFTFGLNKINYIFPRTSFRPSVIVAINHLVIEQNAKFYRETNIPLFIDSKGDKLIPFKDNVHFIESGWVPGVFSKDCSISVCQGYTVTYAAMQLAFYMGFKNIALIGCDHYFSTKGPANTAIISENQDPDHFDPNYFSGGVKWHLPDLPGSEIHYKLARDIFEKCDRKIINSTDGGKLEIFERQPLGEFLET